MQSEQIASRPVVMSFASDETGGDLRPAMAAFGCDEDGPSYRRPPPRLSEHTDELLAELGRDGAEIARLRESGVI